MKEQQRAREQEREHCEGKNAVAPPAAPFQVGRGPGEISEHVQIREVGPDNQGSGAEGGPFSEAAPGQSGADQSVADRVYSSLASISICTFPCNAPETGHPFLADSAALANPA